MHTNQPSRTLAESAGLAPKRVPEVVHSSHGRLRVHLPDWPGTDREQLVAGVCRLPGVTAAEANPLTGNVLIRFEPERTTTEPLLEGLADLRFDLLPDLRLLGADADRALAVFEGDSASAAQTPAPITADALAYVTGTTRLVYQALGWSSVGMAVVGAITPGIPTVPFVILAGYFFVRSSREAHEWLRESRWFGPILRDWEAYRGVRLAVRNAALGLIVASMVATVLLPLPVALKAAILACQVIGLIIVLQLRVVEPVVVAPADDLLSR